MAVAQPQYPQHVESSQPRVNRVMYLAAEFFLLATGKPLHGSFKGRQNSVGENSSNGDYLVSGAESKQKRLLRGRDFQNLFYGVCACV